LEGQAKREGFPFLRDGWWWEEALPGATVDQIRISQASFFFTSHAIICVGNAGVSLKMGIPQ